MGRRVPTARITLVTSLALAGLAVGAAPAQAVFHFMSIREVHPSTNGGDFVELQMYAGGQNFVGGHRIVTYNASGTPNPTPFTFPTDASNGENQRTILVAATEPGFTPTPDFVAATGELNLMEEGAVCFDDIDCVAWGSFSGSLPSAAGPPAPPIPAGSSLERSIAPNCPTLLEAGDDTDNSATDFALAAPSPRNNATAPTETPCAGGAGGLDTRITKAPKNKVRKKRVTYEFTSPVPGASFQCSENGDPFEACTSPHKFKAKKGKNEFDVRAVDPAGNVDQTPAEDKFKLKKKKK
jgi:hypothetical protein